MATSGSLIGAELRRSGRSHRPAKSPSTHLLPVWNQLRSVLHLELMATCGSSITAWVTELERSLHLEKSPNARKGSTLERYWGQRSQVRMGTSGSVTMEAQRLSER